MASIHPLIDAIPTTAHNDVALAQEQRLRHWQLTTWWLAAFATVLVVTTCTQGRTRKEQYMWTSLRWRRKPSSTSNSSTP